MYSINMNPNTYQSNILRVSWYVVSKLLTVNRMSKVDYRNKV